MAHAYKHAILLHINMRVGVLACTCDSNAYKHASGGCWFAHAILLHINMRVGGCWFAHAILLHIYLRVGASVGKRHSFGGPGFVDYI